MAKTKHKESSSKSFDEQRLKRFSAVMGRSYDSARMALSDIDSKREVAVISKGNIAYSGFHQGSGETTVAELLQADLPKYGLILIDEIESSLHPRAQRRLIRDLADKCRELELQIVCTTHSPYVLEELPLEARRYIIQPNGGKSVITGVSPQFEMTKMDDESHPECDVYVEDSAAKTMIGELLAAHAAQLFVRCTIVPYGAASVGYALGQMAANKRFPRPTCVYLDGDSAIGVGCNLLPGEDAPERVIFNDLKARDWGQLHARIGRDISSIIDACSNAMTLEDHHDWVKMAANELKCGGEVLWQAMCAEWAANLSPGVAQSVIQPIEDALS